MKEIHIKEQEEEYSIDWAGVFEGLGFLFGLIMAIIIIVFGGLQGTILGVFILWFICKD